MRVHPIARRHLLLAVAVLCAGYSCAGAPQLKLSAGFDSQVVRNAYAPVRVDVAGLAAPTEGRLIVRQTQGLPGERQSPVAHVIASGMIENGTIWATLPLVEPLNPVVAELEGADSRILARCEESLRLGLQQWAFPVVVGRAVGIPTEAVVGAGELPLDWWAYDAAREVWLLEPSISEPALEALGEWTVSGGSLVLFTGESFPRLDSPTLRRILPITSPHLEPSSDGTFRLVGDLRPGARVTRSRGGAPMLVQAPLGAGTVSLVTVSVQDLGSEEIALLTADIPAVRQPPSTERVSAELLSSTPIARPNFAVAPALALVLVVCFILFAQFAKRGWQALGPLLGVILVASVLSGLYANAKKTFIVQYSVTTNVSIVSSFGINTAFASFYSVEPRRIAMRHEFGSYPRTEQFRATRTETFATESEPGETRFTLRAAERRDLSFHSRPQTEDLSFSVTAGEAWIENRSGRAIANGYVLDGDRVYALPPIEPGAQRVLLQERGIPAEARALYLSLRGVLRPIEEWLPIRRRGVWLVTYEERSQAARANVAETAREVFVTITESEAS